MAVMQLSGLAGIPQQVQSRNPMQQNLGILSGLQQMQQMQMNVQNQQRADRREAFEMQQALKRPESVDYAAIGTLAADMERVGQEMASALESGNMDLYRQKAADYDVLQGRYVAASRGKQYDAKSLKRVAEMQKAIADASKGSTEAERAKYGEKTDKSKVTQEAIKYIDSRVDEVVSSKSKLLEKMQTVRTGAALLDQIQETSAPEQLFAVTKMLSQQIEPGMSVSDGEVRGFLGANQIVEMINLFSSISRGLKSIGDPNEDKTSLAYKASSGDAGAVRQLKTFAKNIGAQARQAYTTLINEGTKNLAADIKADVESAYGNVVDRETLDGIKGRVSSKMASFLGTGTEIPRVKSARTGKVQM